MMLRPFLLTLLLVISACQMPVKETRDADGMLLPGSPCPEFSVVDSQGIRITRESLAGKRAVLWFFPKASTPG